MINGMNSDDIISMQADALAGTPLTPVEQLEAELHLMKTAGIIEVAVRNPSVFDYMKHWEGRVEKAEAELATERQARARLQDWNDGWKAQAEADQIKIEAQAAEIERLRGALGSFGEHFGEFRDDEADGTKMPVRIGYLRKARAALAVRP